MFDGFVFTTLLAGLLLATSITTLRNYLEAKTFGQGCFYFASLSIQLTGLIFVAHTLTRVW